MDGLPARSGVLTPDGRGLYNFVVAFARSLNPPHKEASVSVPKTRFSKLLMLILSCFAVLAAGPGGSDVFLVSPDDGATAGMKVK